MPEKRPNAPTPMTTQLVSMLMLLKDNETAPAMPITTPNGFGSSSVPPPPSAERTPPILEGRQTRRSTQQQLQLQEKQQKQTTDEDEDQSEPTEELCTCKKSRCLKLYCVCFAANIVCNAACKCQLCLNLDAFGKQRSEAIQAILDRNPNAFSSKFKQVSTDGETLAHKSGCRCRRSMCLKKYCECFQASMPCGASCTCIQCCNKVGVDRIDAAAGGITTGASTTINAHTQGSNNHNKPIAATQTLLATIPGALNNSETHTPFHAAGIAMLKSSLSSSSSLSRQNSTTSVASTSSNGSGRSINLSFSSSLTGNGGTSEVFSCALATSTATPVRSLLDISRTTLPTDSSARELVNSSTNSHSSSSRTDTNTALNIQALSSDETQGNPKNKNRRRMTIAGNYSQGCAPKLLQVWRSSSSFDAVSQLTATSGVLGKGARREMEISNSLSGEVGLVGGAVGTAPPPLKKRRVSRSTANAAEDKGSNAAAEGGGAAPVSLLGFKGFAEKTTEMFSMGLERTADALKNILRPTLLTRVRSKDSKRPTSKTNIRASVPASVPTNVPTNVSRSHNEINTDPAPHPNPNPYPSSSLPTTKEGADVSASIDSNAQTSAVPDANNSSSVLPGGQATTSAKAGNVWENSYYDSKNLSGIAVLAKLIGSPSPVVAGRAGRLPGSETRDVDKAQFSGGSTETSSSTSSSPSEVNYDGADENKENLVNVPVSRGTGSTSKRPVPLASRAGLGGAVGNISAIKPPLHRPPRDRDVDRSITQAGGSSGGGTNNGTNNGNNKLSCVSSSVADNNGLGVLSPSVRGYVRTNLLSPLCKVEDDQ